MLRLYSLVILLHVYPAWRLLPDLPFGPPGVGLLSVWLISSACLLPLGLLARRIAPQPHADRLAWAGMIAMGSFSSLFVLTFMRDAGLLIAYALGRFELQTWSAAAAPLLAALFTLVGFINARRTAAVRTVEVTIVDLPAALHGFTIVQISDPAAAMHGAPAHAMLRLLLAHQPRSAYAAEPAGFHLQLSGHTHGGQFWPWNFAVRLQQPFTAGLSRMGALWVYTSRGTGYWGPPKRLGAPSEITHLRLVSA